MSEENYVLASEMLPEEKVNDLSPTSITSQDELKGGPMIPLLRVEQIKGEEGCSSAYTSEDDCHSGLSDTEGSAKKGKKELGPYVEPDEELQEKIITQVEFYFSDANILKDAFLLKHVRRNKQGYVSIKLITSFKKVKSLTKDFRQVAFSLQQSEKLTVNEEGTKVKRNDALPDYDETTPSRTVVAINLPTENPTIEDVSGLFSKCGEVSLIRIIRPGKSIPNDIKKHISKHPHLGNVVCAVVEFESYESAKVACETLTNKGDWRDGLNVVPLMESRKKNGKQDAGSDTELGDEKKKRAPKGTKKKNDRISTLAHENDSSCYSSGSDGEDDHHHMTKRSGNQRQGSAGRKSQSPTPNRLTPNKYLSPKSSPQSSPHSSPSTSPLMRRRAGSHGKSPLAKNGSPNGSPQGSPQMQRNNENGSGDSAPTSPWVQRRLKAAQELSPLLKDGSPNSSPQLGRRFEGPRVIIMRQPKGPDGSKGFSSFRTQTAMT